jgi:hypothetical protein
MLDIFAAGHKITNNQLIYDMICLPFQSTRVHPRFLVGSVLLDLYVYVL